MKGVATLVRHSFRQRRWFLSAIFLVLFLLQIVMILVASEFHRKGAFAQLQSIVPPFMQQWTNSVGLSFQGFVLFGYSHPIVIIFLVAMAIALSSEIGLEIETKFVDLLMARPLPRATPVIRSTIVLVVAAAAALGTMLVGSWLGLALLADATATPPDRTLLLSMAANLAALVLAWGGITLGIASFGRRRSATIGIAGLLAFAMFVLDYVGRFWERAREVSRISPFHYYDPFGMMGGKALSAIDLAILLGIFATGTILALGVYARRDL